jgi:4-diphosphocytidyl-2-C-methyl-D-erythritol kinase
MHGPIEVLCPAKINLGLRVLEKREDGYHNVETVLQRITLFDRIRLERNEQEGINLACPESGLSEGAENIVWQAAVIFLECIRPKGGVAIRLWKRIPTAAGLGGGSSDAAGTLLGLNSLFGRPIPKRTLVEMGAALGADVPFFILQVSSALGEGRGDRLTPVRIPWFWFVLVSPGFEVSTAWAYRNLRSLLTRPENKPIKLTLNQHPFRLEEVIYNDLEQVSIAAYPEIGGIKQTLISLGSMAALMSGSGPTVFGIFPNRSEASRVQSILSSHSIWKSFLARSF